MTRIFHCALNSIAFSPYVILVPRITLVLSLQGALALHRNGNGVPMPMIGPAKLYFIVFGLFTIVGGVMGYVKAGSTASIIAGSIAGIALLIAAFCLPGNQVVGLVLGGVISLALAGQFIPKFLKTHAIMPAGLMSLLSVIGLILAIAAWMKK